MGPLDSHDSLRKIWRNSWSQNAIVKSSFFRVPSQALIIPIHSGISDRPGKKHGHCYEARFQKECTQQFVAFIQAFPGNLSWVIWGTHIRVIFINFAPLLSLANKYQRFIHLRVECKPVVLYHLKTHMLHGTEIFTYIWLYHKCRWRFQSHGAFGKDLFFFL